MSQSGTERVKGAVERVARAIAACRANPSTAATRGHRPDDGKMRDGEADKLWSLAVEEARAAIAEYEAALRDAGFVVVPKELTREMARIGALYCNGAMATRFMWEDVLAACPR